MRGWSRLIDEDHEDGQPHLYTEYAPLMAGFDSWVYVILGECNNGASAANMEDVPLDDGIKATDPKDTHGDIKKSPKKKKSLFKRLFGRRNKRKENAFKDNEKKYSFFQKMLRRLGYI